MRYSPLYVIPALALLAAIFYWTNSAASDRALANADQALTARAQSSADAIDRTLQQRMIEVFTFATLPSLRGTAASDPIDRQIRLPVARAELASIAAADPNIRVAMMMDAAGVVIMATDASVNTTTVTGLVCAS